MDVEMIPLGASAKEGADLGASHKEQPRGFGLDMNQEFRDSLVVEPETVRGAGNTTRRSPLDTEGQQQIATTESNRGQLEARDSKNKAVIYFLFFVILTMNLLINFDHGVMPAGAVEMKQDLNLTNAEYGWLGSVVFIGLTLGSISASFLYQKCNQKCLLLFVLLSNAISLSLFTFTKAYALLVISRFLTGFFQVFISIYYPVWADCFGTTDKQKTTWMSILLFSSSLGVLIGYIVTAQMIQKVSWQWSFYIQIFATIPLFLIILATPLQYLDFNIEDSDAKDDQALLDQDSNIVGVSLNQADQFLQEQNNLSIQNQTSSMDQKLRVPPLTLNQQSPSLTVQRYDSPSVNNRSQNRRSAARPTSWNEKFGHQTEIFRRTASRGGHSSSSSHNNQRPYGQFSPTQTQMLLAGTPSQEQLSEEDEENFFISIWELCRNSVYLLLVLAISSLYFVVSGLQFWITTYMTTVLQAPLSEVYTFYIVTCFTAPALGVLLSIFLFNHIGGYNTRGAFWLALLFGALAVIVSIPVPFAKNCTTVYVLLWLIFFLGSIILAPLVGMMLNQVPRQGRTTANSLATLCYNLFGYFPAPFVFGGIADSDKADPIGSMRYAMGTVTYWSIFAALFLLAATLIRMRQLTKEEEPAQMAAQDAQYARMGKQSPISQRARPQLVQAEEALSSHLGDSQVTLPNQATLHTTSSQPVLTGQHIRRTTGMSETSGEEADHIKEPQFYAGALRQTQGIYDNTLGPSGRFVESMASPDQQYLRQNTRKVDNRHSINLERVHGPENRFSIAQDTHRPSNRRSAPLRPQSFGTAGGPENRKKNSTSTRLQLLNFESSHQSIFHGVLPVALGLSMVKEDATVVDTEDGIDSDGDGEESEAHETHQSDRLGATQTLPQGIGMITQSPH